MLLAESTRLLSRGHRLNTDSELRSAPRTFTSNVHRWYFHQCTTKALRFASYLKRKRAHEHRHTIKRFNDTTNSLLPSLSSILKQRRRYRALSLGGYFSSTCSNRLTLNEKVKKQLIVVNSALTFCAIWHYLLAFRWSAHSMHSEQAFAHCPHD